MSNNATKPKMELKKKKKTFTAKIYSNAMKSKMPLPIYKKKKTAENHV